MPCRSKKKYYTITFLYSEKLEWISYGHQNHFIDTAPGKEKTRNILKLDVPGSSECASVSTS